jgi:sugar O-acyltransferase (sialic acid O-acetyltransferase NeuD family)
LKSVLNELLILGAGGHAREVALLIDTINEVRPRWEIVGFFGIADHARDNIRGVPIIAKEDVARLSRDVYFVPGMGSPQVKLRAVAEMFEMGFHSAATLIHPEVSVHESIRVGDGVIICRGSILTVDIIVGDYVTVNLGCTVTHDDRIGSYVTLSPACNISGGVILEEGAFLGTNSSVIEGVTIGAWSKVGAGAAVIRDIPAHCTAVGIPARLIDPGSNSP